MKAHKDGQLGFGAIELILIVGILVALGVSGWIMYGKQVTTGQPKASTTNTNATGQTTDTIDPTANWRKVDSIGGAYSMRVPDGWALTNYPGNVMMADEITLSDGKPAVVATASTPYAGDQKRFNVSFSEKTNGQTPAPQWQSPNPYGTETTEDFSIGNLKGTRFSIEYTQTVTGVTKGDKLYQYEFFLPDGKGLNVLYIQYSGDADNLKTVEQAIQTIVIH